MASRELCKQTLRRGVRSARRRGTSVVLVLCVISVTLAMSYAIIRSQGTALQIQANSRHRSNARLAAMTGIKIAIGKMHGENWTGVGTSITGNLSDTDQYKAVFETGDPSLDSEDAEYWRYPYRVTVNVTGSSKNPLTDITSTHRMRAVVQLVPRTLSSEPDDWESAEPYTVYQWSSDATTIQLPVQIQGPVHLEGDLAFCEDYPAVDSRPFDGSIRDVALFRSALSAGDIKAIYNTMKYNHENSVAYNVQSPIAWWRLEESSGATVAVDEIGNNPGAYVGASPRSYQSPFGASIGAAKFDGNNDYVNVGAMDVSGSAMTILAWFYADSSPKNYARIISKATGNGLSKINWALGLQRISSTKNRLWFSLKAGGIYGWCPASDDSVEAKEIIFAAAVYDGSNMKIYQNGELVGSESHSGMINTNASAPVFIGDNPPGSPRAKYLRDLRAMYANGASDHRPLTGPVYLKENDDDEVMLSMLRDDLGIEVSDQIDDSHAPAEHPEAVAKYQLYPGGEYYKVVNLQNDWLEGQDLKADLIANPLGIFYRKGHLVVSDNVTIQGTIITQKGYDVYFLGKNLNIAPARLPKAENSDKTPQLPVIIAGDDIRLYGDADGTIAGLLYTPDKFWQKDDRDKNRSLTITGKVLAAKLRLFGRDSWVLDDNRWKTLLSQFISKTLSGALSGVFFPEWLENSRSFWAKPILTIKPESTPISYHWQDWDQPIFQPHPDDPGLRWDLLEWTDVN